MENKFSIRDKMYFIQIQFWLVDIIYMDCRKKMKNFGILLKQKLFHPV